MSDTFKHGMHPRELAEVERRAEAFLRSAAQSTSQPGAGEERLREALIEAKKFHEFCLERAPKMTPCYAAEHADQIADIDKALTPPQESDQHG